MRPFLPVLAAALLIAGSSQASPETRGAVLRSVVLPGWGQRHLGHAGRGNIFLGVEAATWAGVALSYLEGTFAEDDFEILAAEEAGLDASGRDGDFLEDVGDFGSSSEYNDFVHRLARYYYPDDPVAQQQYYDLHAYYGDMSWDWSSEDAREDFADALQESRQWYRRSLYIGMFAVVNRAVSAIDAALLSNRGQVLYSELSVPDPDDFSSVRMSVGFRF
jgi:hypothetical protein